MPSDSPKETDGLDNNLRDKLVATGRALAGIAPWCGGALGEILTAVIPGQRADRIVAYLRQLSVRIDQLEESVQLEIVASPAKVELIEEGGYQAARALSADRVSQIVEAVANGITSDEADVIRRKRLLKLFGELDDDEVALLNAYGRNYANRDEEAWEKANRPDPAHMQSAREDVDRERLFEAGRSHLTRLGLLREKVTTDRSGAPHFDKNAGDFKRRTEIAYLGRLLLREVGMSTPFDLQAG